jgi:hypothetical protein
MISSRWMAMSRGALIPIRTWLPRISSTVTVMLVPIVTDCLGRRVKMRMIDDSFRSYVVLTRE